MTPTSGICSWGMSVSSWRSVWGSHRRSSPGAVAGGRNLAGGRVEAAAQGGVERDDVLGAQELDADQALLRGEEGALGDQQVEVGVGAAVVAVPGDPLGGLRRRDEALLGGELPLDGPAHGQGVGDVAEYRL